MRKDPKPRQREHPSDAQKKNTKKDGAPAGANSDSESDDADISAMKAKFSQLLSNFEQDRSS